MPDLPGRRKHEDELAAALLLVFQQSRDSLRVSAKQIADAAYDTLRAVYLDAVRNFLRVAAENSPPIPPDGDAESAAAEWARQYAGTLGREISGSTRDLLARADDVDAVFSAERAAKIAVTEVTRTVSVAEAWLLLFWQTMGFGGDRERVWHTEEDGLVCPVCRPLNRKPESTWKGTAPAGPPAHPNCRCWLDYHFS